MSARRGRDRLVPLTDEVIAYTYARVSSDDQEKDGLSLPVQDKETLAYVAARETWAFGGAFVDVQTGSVVNRADYQRMLAAARATSASGKRVAIVVVKQTRFGRDIEELARAWKELGHLDAELHATRDGGLIADPLMYGIRSVLAANDLRVISEGVRATFRDVRAAGWLKPGRPRWGYRWEPATAEQRVAGAPNVVPVPHQTEADYVRELFVRRADGASIRELATWVRGLPAPARGDRELSVSSVKDVLDSAVYIARNARPRVDPLDTDPGKWQPLCDDATWRKIHPRDGERENTVPISTRGAYPLTHYLFCEACGARMCGQVRRGYRRSRPGRAERTDPDKRIYICTSRMAGASHDGPACYRTIGADLIEREIFGTFRSVIAALTEPGIRELARREAQDAEERASSTGDARRLRNAEYERAELVAERVGLTRSLSKGILSGDAYAEAVAVISAAIETQDTEIARLTALVGRTARRARERPMIDVILDQAAFWQSALETGTVDDQREFLRLVLESSTPKRLSPGEYLAGMRLTSLGQRMMEVGAALMPSVGYPVEAVQRAWANCTTSTRPDQDLRAAS
jgi:DNA invertase Pin-like site-specific DNA recombinase